MGMFDMVVPDKKRPIKCPGCSRSLKSFQTKDLADMMYCYIEGQTARKVEGLRLAKKSERGPHGFPFFAGTGKFTIVPHPQYHRFYAYEWCEKCKKMVGQFFQFDEKGLLARYGDPAIEK